MKIDRAGTRARGDGSSWTVESLIIVGATASVSAQPPTGTVATCRILLDGKRAIAANTGPAGQSVLCKATGPKFDR